MFVWFLMETGINPRQCLFIFTVYAKSFGTLVPAELPLQREAEKNMFTAHVKQTSAQTTKLV